MPRYSFIPKDEKFFALFEQSAQNAVKIAEQLSDMIHVWENVRERVGIITDLEHQGDAITHQVTAHLNYCFVPPFDRGDISLLASSLDDITDFVHSAADAMLIYKVERPTARVKELADILVQAVLAVERGVSEIHNHIERINLLERCVEINRLENMADSAYRSALAELYASPVDISQLIKWREIYGHIESAIDRCEDVANVLEGVALKYT